ncbi:hypothetical protein NE237_027909 [Protea cynaroides]|uniref:Acyl-CoA oxidase C-alpha1 domain-containing protein n=1 Tax=Protea cynaroides TaxID=273540 RepID=A0A9Q0JTL8_9MAGN|nr:hypothetical protein NE237_027909 [Protea cynaroides]
MCLESCSYSWALSLAVWMATRYSAFRRPFGSQDGGPEIQVIDYKTQQNRPFPLLASAYAYRGDNSIKNHWNCSIKKKLDLYLVSGSAGDPHLINFPEFDNHETKAGCLRDETVRQIPGILVSLDHKMDWECGIGICLQGTLLGNVKGFQRQLQLQLVENAPVEACRSPEEGLHGLRKPASVIGCDDNEATANDSTNGQCGSYADRLDGSHDNSSIQPELSCSTSSGFF